MRRLELHAALHLALLVAGVAPGDEVVTVSHSYVATANSIRQCDAEPVFVDIAADSFNIDPATGRTGDHATHPRDPVVHQIGMPCDLARLVPLARPGGWC